MSNINQFGTANVIFLLNLFLELYLVPFSFTLSFFSKSTCYMIKKVGIKYLLAKLSNPSYGAIEVATFAVVK